MCGKAPPFRSERINDHRGYASVLADNRIGGIASSNIKEVTHGEAQPYRTSGSRAANPQQRNVLFKEKMMKDRNQILILISILLILGAPRSISPQGVQRPW